jgi:DNA-binding transcriptional MerR regulator
MTPIDLLIEAEREHGPLLTTAEVSRNLQITLRQLQWWDERRIIQPAFLCAHKRYYGERQVAELRRLASLRKAGCSLQSSRKFLKLKNWQTAISARKGTVIGDVLVIP